MKYSIDTSVLVVPYRHWPDPTRLVTLWEDLGDRIENQEIVATKEVYTEIDQKDDSLMEWVEARKYMFIEIDEEQQTIQKEIMKQFPRWVDHDRQKNDADPWVIALAIKYNLVAVSNERSGSEENPTIPYVCKKFGVEHLSLKKEFLEAINWQA